MIRQVIFTADNIWMYTDFFSSFEPQRLLSFEIIVLFSIISHIIVSTVEEIRGH